MVILAINSGGSSIKYEIFYFNNGKQVSCSRGAVKRLYRPDSFLEQMDGHTQIRKELPSLNHDRGLSLIIETVTGDGPLHSIDQIDAVGIKLINAGLHHTTTQLINQSVVHALQDLANVTGVHNPPAITTIELFGTILPGTPLVGVFETDFHRTIPTSHRTYGLPWILCQRYGLEKLGFHGNSHKYSTQRIKVLESDARKIVSCHLGSGSSICAILNGQSYDISSGFTPQSGTIMSTRPGDLDAQILLYLQEKAGYSWSDINRILLQESGLFGISGKTAEMWELETLADQGDERSRLAIDVFIYQVKKYIGSYYALMNGIDVLSFTGGIGENDPAARESICRDLDSLGIVIDHAHNVSCAGQEARVNQFDSPVSIWVIPANEEHLVAAETFSFLESNSGKR